MKNGFKAFAYFLIIPSFCYMIFCNFIKNELLVNVLSYIVLLLFFLFISRREIKIHFNDFKTNFRKYIVIILKWVATFFILMMLSNYLIQIFVDVLPNNEISNRNIIKENPILALLYLLVIAPFLEEYVFRFSFKDIKNYYFYTILTCSLFSTLHILSAESLYELWYFIPYFILGLGFCNVFFKTKNYFASVISHMIHNALCVIIIMLF